MKKFPVEFLGFYGFATLLFCNINFWLICGRPFLFLFYFILFIGILVNLYFFLMLNFLRLYYLLWRIGLGIVMHFISKYEWAPVWLYKGKKNYSLAYLGPTKPNPCLFLASSVERQLMGHSNRVTIVLTFEIGSTSTS